MPNTLPDILPDFSEMTDSQKMNIYGIAITQTRNRVDFHEKLLVTGDPPKELPIPERIRKLEDFRDTFQYWFRILIGALILQTVAFGYGIFIAVVKFLPILERLSQQSH